MTRLKGQCLCGDVQFETPLPGHIDACHCTTCRNWNGGPFIGADFRNGITITKDEGLTWYESCIAGGALKLPDGLKLNKEIFIDEKPDYYNLAGEQKRLTGAEAFAEFTSGDDYD